MSFPSGCHVISPLYVRAARTSPLRALRVVLVSRMADRDSRDNLEPPLLMESNPTTSTDSTGGLERVVGSSPGHHTTDDFDGSSSSQPAAAVS